MDGFMIATTIVDEVDCESESVPVDCLGTKAPIPMWWRFTCSRSLIFVHIMCVNYRLTHTNWTRKMTLRPNFAQTLVFVTLVELISRCAIPKMANMQYNRTPIKIMQWITEACRIACDSLGSLESNWSLLPTLLYEECRTTASFLCGGLEVFVPTPPFLSVITGRGVVED